MPSSDTYFKIDETTPKNAVMLNLIKSQNLSVSELARRLDINKSRVSLALNNKLISIAIINLIKIARYFKKDSREIWK